MRVWQIGWILCGLLLTACGGVTPRATPTVAPTTSPMPTTIALLPSSTPSQTITASVTPSQTGTATDQPQPTSTLTLTATTTSTVTPLPTVTTTVQPSATLTLTPTVTSTATATTTASSTPTLTPSATFTAVPTATPTPIPTNTPVPTVTPFFSATPPPSNTPTATPSVTVTASITPTPSATFTPTLDATRLLNDLLTAQALTAEAEPSATPQPTWTPVPQASPTNTIAPTLDATPFEITVDAPVTQIAFPSPVPSTPEFAPDAPTVTPLPTTPPLPPTPTATVFLTPIPPPISFAGSLTPLNVQAARFNGVSAIFQGQSVPGAVSLFAVNPSDPNSYARVDPAGNMAIVPRGGGGETGVIGSPFYDGQPLATDANQNADRVVEIAWSPDGTKLAFVILSPLGTNGGDTGLWVWFGGPAFAQGYDCPPGGEYTAACALADEKVTDHYNATQVAWRSDSNAMLVQYNTLWNGRSKRAFAVVPVVAATVPTAPRLWFYDSATYMNDGRILVSGEAPNGQWVVGIMTMREDGQPDEPMQELMDADTPTPNWVEAAAQRPDGAIVAFGRPGGPNDGPYALGIVSNGTWQQLGPFIGNAPPSRIAWGPNRTQAVVTVNGIQYVVDSRNGSVAVLDG